MTKPVVSVVKYEKAGESVRKAVELSSAMKSMPLRGRIFIKPNLVYINAEHPYPKWGVITTSRVVEDTVLLLKEHGIDDITIGEGSVIDPKDRETPLRAFESLGYDLLRKRYGVKIINVFERPFKKVNLNNEIDLNFNSDFLESDFIVNLPVMKTHSQTVVSLGCKNLKGLLDINSRKKCHSTDKVKDLHHIISLIPDISPPSMTIIDGIYTNEKGPMFGNIRRSNILVASEDMLSADMVGAKLLGYNPSDVPHIKKIADRRERNKDLSDIDIKGEDLTSLIQYHEYAIPYTEDGNLSMDLHSMGVRGLTFKNPGTSICTYCVGLIGLISAAIAFGTDKKPLDGIEILSGKTLEPSGKDKTILLGKCMYMAHKDNKKLKEIYHVKGCPPDEKEIVKTLNKIGISINPDFLEKPEILLMGLLSMYENRKEFDDKFFRVI